MSETTGTRVFRGESDRVAAINAVDGLDISKLHEKHAGALGEATSYVFPVRAQLTWFRAKNPTGRVETEILFEDPYRAHVKAIVYDENEKKLATGHGTANIEDDVRFANKLIETAESRAVSRALDNAGFGCQLSAKTFDEDDAKAPDRATPSDAAAIHDGLPAMPGEATIPASMPDRINGAILVDPNSSTQPLDISSLQDNSPTNKNDAPQSDKGRSGSRRKTESSTPEAEPASTKYTETSAGEQAPPAAAGASEDEAGNGAVAPDDSEQPSAGELTVDANMEVIPSDQNSTATTSSAVGDTQSSKRNMKTVTDMMYESIQTMDPIQPAGFDKQYFGDGLVDPNAFYINRNGKETRIRNEELQKAIIFFSQNQELILDVLFVAKKPEINGKPIREIIAMGEYGESALFTWAFAYRGDLLALQAATLVYYQNTPSLWRWEQKEPA